MNVTEGKIKDRQSREGSCPQMVFAEQRENAGESDCVRIAENNNTDTASGADSLLERILNRDNLNKVYKWVKFNKGAGGVDGMSVDGLLPYLKENRERQVEQIRVGEI